MRTRKKSIPVVQNTGTLEYELSSTIKRLTLHSRKKIGLLNGNGEPALNELTYAQEACASNMMVHRSM